MPVVNNKNHGLLFPQAEGQGWKYRMPFPTPETVNVLLLVRTCEITGYYRIASVLVVNPWVLPFSILQCKCGFSLMYQAMKDDRIFVEYCYCKTGDSSQCNFRVNLRIHCPANWKFWRKFTKQHTYVSGNAVNLSYCKILFNWNFLKIFCWKTRVVCSKDKCVNKLA